MTGIPSMPNFSGGLRKQRAEQFKAELEEAKQKAESGADGQVSGDEQDTGSVGQGDYIVKNGDCILSIAKDTGHFWEKVWNEPSNAELNQVRQDPNLLLAGDRVTLPDIVTKEEPGAAEMRHRFVRRGEPARLQLRIHGDSEPRSGEAYRAIVDGREIARGLLGSDGEVALLIPGNAREGLLIIGTGEDEEEFRLQLGHIAPLSEVAGVQGRLRNLGYDCGSVDGLLGANTIRALRQFQRENNLDDSGQPDETTRRLLADLHLS